MGVCCVNGGLQNGTVLINAVTGEVGPSTQVSGYPTNQELSVNAKRYDRLDRKQIRRILCDG